jgi:hypothetical protein
VTGFIRAVPAVFQVTPTQDQASYAYGDSTGSLTAQIQRTPLVQP